MSKEDFLRALEGEEELEITFKGRKTGKEYSTDVSFTTDDGRVYLLPIRGSKNNWYKNVRANPEMRISVGDRTFEVTARPLTSREDVEKVKELISEKYGEDYLERWYSVFDAAVELVP